MGAVRTNYEIEDCQQCFYNLIKRLTDTTAPWTSWEPQLSYLEQRQDRKTAKPIIYIMTPSLGSQQWQQGGLSLGFYDIMIGVWDDRGKGGEEEINIICSHILGFFSNPQSCHTQQFTVTTDVANTNTNLVSMGIRVEEIVGPRSIATKDLKEFRREFIIRFLT